jgi:hypothetical protein
MLNGGYGTILLWVRLPPIPIKLGFREWPVLNRQIADLKIKKKPPGRDAGRLLMRLPARHCSGSVASVAEL